MSVKFTDVGIQTYRVREMYTAYKTNMQNDKGGRRRYKLPVFVVYTQSTIQGCKNFWGGRWRYKLIVSVKYTQSTIHSFKISRVDVGIETYSVREIYTVHNTRMQKIKGGRWRYKCVREIYKILQGSTFQGWTLALQTCSVRDICIHNLQYKDAKFPGWTLMLQTCNVRENYAVYNTIYQEFTGRRWNTNL